MGMRFRKSKKILPGVRLNLSKSGLSASFGGKFAGITINSKGEVTKRAGIPGTGLSYVTKDSSMVNNGANARQTAQIPYSCASNGRLWDIKPCESPEIYLVSGDIELPIYTYNSYPLNGLSGKFRLKATPFDCTMKSVHTGFVKDTGKDDNAVILMHENDPIGIAPIRKSLVKAKFDDGYFVEFEAKIDGFVPGYDMVSKVVILVPDADQEKWY